MFQIMYLHLFVTIGVVNLIKCEWVEIPQTVLSDQDTLTKNTDITMYMQTTTSTTTQTPIFVKPLIIRKSDASKIIDTNTNDDIRITTTTHVPDFIKPTPETKKITVKSTKKLNNVNYYSTTNLPVLTQNVTNNMAKNGKKHNNISNTDGGLDRTHKHVLKTPLKINRTNVKSDSFSTNKMLSVTPTGVVENDESITNLDETENEHFDEEEEEGDVDDDEEEELNDPVESKKENENNYSYTSFIPYLSTIQSTLMKNAHKNKKSKLNVLTNLRDHLLLEIENRIALWNPKAEATKGRKGREYKEDSHMDFPSNEGALMTIGFLTFAVFLIKLVLQLVQALSNKMDNGDGTTTTYIGRKRRSVEDEDAIKILNYIEQYQFKTI